MQHQIKALILAAGKGTRLQTEGTQMPKVLRLANGQPLLSYVLNALRFIDRKDIILIVGYNKEKVIDTFDGYSYAVQAEQLGTGHAVQSAEPLLRDFNGSVLVCCGDMPLIKRETYQALFDVHFENKNDCTILSGTTDIPLPYGRIIRDNAGQFSGLVEEKDATPAERAVTELNSGVYVFEIAKLLPALLKLQNNNVQGEYYLTDVPSILLSNGGKIGICKRNLGSEIIGVNTAAQLEQVEDILRTR